MRTPVSLSLLSGSHPSFVVPSLHDRCAHFPRSEIDDVGSASLRRTSPGLLEPLIFLVSFFSRCSFGILCDNWTVFPELAVHSRAGKCSAFSSLFHSLLFYIFFSSPPPSLFAPRLSNRISSKEFDFLSSKIRPFCPGAPFF